MNYYILITRRAQQWRQESMATEPKKGIRFNYFNLIVRKEGVAMLNIFQTNSSRRHHLFFFANYCAPLSADFSIKTSNIQGLFSGNNIMFNRIFKQHLQRKWNDLKMVKTRRNIQMNPEIFVKTFFQQKDISF
ncbi:MAG: hypothetical protein IPJ74_13180 [Saprospiraceae bacterium]|nr:hypothetical protein [Saprospiraceae bacterium]